MIESGMVVDTTIPKTIIAETSRKCLSRNDFRRSSLRGPEGEVPGTPVHSPVLLPMAGCFDDPLDPATHAEEGRS